MVSRRGPHNEPACGRWGGAWHPGRKATGCRRVGRGSGGRKAGRCLRGARDVVRAEAGPELGRGVGRAGKGGAAGTRWQRMGLQAKVNLARGMNCRKPCP